MFSESHSGHRRQSGPDENPYIDSPKLRMIAKAVQSKPIPVREKYTHNVADYEKTFRTLESFIAHIIDALFDSNYYSAYRTLNLLTEFITINGLFNFSDKKVPLSNHSLEELTPSSLAILSDYAEAIKNSTQSIPNKVDYLNTLKTLVNGYFSRRITLSNLNNRLDEQEVSGLSVDDFATKVMKHSNSVEELLVHFNYLREYLLSIGALRYSDGVYEYVLTYSNLDRIVLVAIEENLFGLNAICKDKHNYVVAKDSGKDHTEYKDHINLEYVKSKFKEH